MNNLFSQAEALIAAAKAETEGIRFIKAYKAQRAETPLGSPAAYVSVDRAEYEKDGFESGRIDLLVYGTDSGSAYETGELAQTIAEAFETADTGNIITGIVIGEPQWDSKNGSVYREVRISLWIERTSGSVFGVEINGSSVPAVISFSVRESGERFEAREILTGNTWHSEIPGYRIEITVSGRIDADFGEGFEMTAGDCFYTGCELTGSEIRKSSEGGAKTSLIIKAEKRVRL